MKIDQESKKIGLSIRRARPEEWDGVVSSYAVGQIVPGEVTKLVTFGAFARLDGPVEGLIHVSELVDRRITHPKEVVAEGDVVPVKIVRIERERHRLGLSLRQARTEAEQKDWIFTRRVAFTSCLLMSPRSTEDLRSAQTPTAFRLSRHKRLQRCPRKTKRNLLLPM